MSHSRATEQSHDYSHSILGGISRTVEGIGRGSLKFPRDATGTTAQIDDGEFTMYRDVVYRPNRTQDATATLSVRYRLKFPDEDVGPRQVALTDRVLSVLLTPYFAGLDGFRGKQWSLDERTGEYLSRYAFTTEAAARAAIDPLTGLMNRIAVDGSVSFAVAEGPPSDW